MASYFKPGLCKQFLYGSAIPKRGLSIAKTKLVAYVPKESSMLNKLNFIKKNIIMKNQHNQHNFIIVNVNFLYLGKVRISVAKSK